MLTLPESARRPEPIRSLTRRDFLRLSAGVGAGVLLAGCGNGNGGVGRDDAIDYEAVVRDGYDGPDVNVGFWHGLTGGDGPFLRALVDRFNNEHPNIQVGWNAIAWDEFYSVVPTAVSSGQGPDIGIMHTDQVATNAVRNVVVPIEQMVDALGLDSTDFPTEVWNAGVYGDQRYGLPLDVHPMAFYYNKRVMEAGGLDPDAPPQTGAELMQALEQLKDAGIRGFWYTPFHTFGMGFHTLLRQFGGKPYNDDLTEATFNSGEGVEALNWLLDLIRNDYSPANLDNGAERIAFINSDNAFNCHGVWAIGQYTAAGEDAELDFGVAPVPLIGSQQAVWGGSHNFVVMNTPEVNENRRRAVAVFFDWIGRHSVEWAAAGQVPARASVRESAEFAEYEMQATVATQLDHVYVNPTLPGIHDAQQELELGVQEGLLMEKDPQTALDDAVRRANERMEQNRQRYGT